MSSQLSVLKECQWCLQHDDEHCVATHQCADCKVDSHEYLCELHANIHKQVKKFKSHNMQSLSFGPICDLKINPTFKLSEFKFYQPSSCVIAQQSLFVTDRDSIFEFNLKSGELVQHFNEPQERYPRNLCYDPSDDTLVYCIERGSSFDVVKLSKNGKRILWELQDQLRISDMCVDKMNNGNVYTVQKDGIVVINKGKVVNTLRDDLNGDNMFINIAYDSLVGVATDCNDQLIISTKRWILICDKKGKILKKGQKIREGESCRIQIDPIQSDRIYYIGDECLESCLLNGTKRMILKYDPNYEERFEIYCGAGLDFVIDFESRQLIVANICKGKIQVFH